MKNTAEKRAEICRHIATGLSRDDACTLAGINRATFYRWLKDATFATAVNQAEIRNKQLQVTRVQVASERDWRAAAWWLERKFPEEFGKREKIEHNGKLPFLSIFDNLPSENMTDKAAMTE